MFDTVGLAKVRWNMTVVTAHRTVVTAAPGILSANAWLRKLRNLRSHRAIIDRRITAAFR